MQLHGLQSLDRVGVSSCRRGVVSIWSMFVFLALLIFYPNATPSEFVMATKTSRAAKLYWRPLNSKGSLPVLKWTSESEYFSETLFFFAEAKCNHFTPRCACATRGKYDFKGEAMSLFRENTWVAGV